jgi:Hemin uptake protein hemP
MRPSSPRGSGPEPPASALPLAVEYRLRVTRAEKLILTK